MKATFEEFKKAIENLNYEVDLEWQNSKYIWCATLSTNTIKFAGLEIQAYTYVLLKILGDYKLSISIRNTDKGIIRIHCTGE